MNARVAKGFDFLSSFYDKLARAIIGKDIVLSQIYFLDRFSQCKRLLILGGGSGWILNEIRGHYPFLKIDYIDLSPGMMDRARKRIKNTANVNFITGSEDNLLADHYDGVITNFFLDMFSEWNLSNLIEKIKSSLHREAIWVVTDFVNERKMQAIKLWWMYRFFRIIAGIEAASLPDWQYYLLNAGFKLSASRRFNNGFIASHVYLHTPVFKPEPSVEIVK